MTKGSWVIPANLSETRNLLTVRFEAKPSFTKPSTLVIDSESRSYLAAQNDEGVLGHSSEPK